MLPTTKESFAKTLDALVRKFDADRETYVSSGYGEAQVRSHFITPFFKALGWDVENEAGVPYHLCEVWEEKGETQGRPDYTFRLNGQTKFFIEAKAPCHSLGNAGPILQTKSYAWNSKDVLLAGLTHFEEFRFFDASLEPDERRVLDGEAFHLQSSEYLDKVDLLWELSPARVAEGSLDQFLRRDRKSIRYRIPVDQRFLDELTEWRHKLASNIHRLNPAIDARQLNDIVQRLLDRIVFIRIAEERKVIEPSQLRDLIDLWEQRGGKLPIMDDLVALFSQINNDFNGEIFKPHPCEQVKLESGVLAQIIRRLYPPKSPYRFDVIGVELLGSIYERYLGNVLQITAKQVRLVPKPEIQKAGGVYYTPQFIVDYIVRNTIGPLVEGKTPKEIEKLRIVDPACGSGSFLIGAFQFLIDWHLNYYHDHPKEAEVHPMYPETVRDPDGTTRLSFHAKTRILRQNLYGVDLDQQAVEITMMSLYLKALEAERGMLAPKHQVLPELKYNIRCGNSLISTDIEKDEALTAEERRRVRPFDWNSRESGFGDILAAGGFDAVIGNPPYVRIQTTHVDDIAYYNKHYASAVGNYDIYCLFVERGLQYLKKTCRLGFILPHRFFKSDYGQGLRSVITQKAGILSIVDFDGYMVFENASINTCVLILSTNKSSQISFLRAKFTEMSQQNVASLLLKDHRASDNNFEAGEIDGRHLSDAPWVFVLQSEESLWGKLESIRPKLGEVATEIFQGFKTGSDAIYIGEILKESPKLWHIRFLADDKERKIESALMLHLIKGGEMKRFVIAPSERAILFPYQKGKLIPARVMADKYPNAWEYLRSKKSDLEIREDEKMRGPNWYAYTRSQALTLMPQTKIIVPDYYAYASFGLDLQGQYSFCGGGAGGYGIVLGRDLDPRYVVALLNSKVLDWYLRKVTIRAYQTAYMYVKKYIEQLPIKIPAGKELRISESIVGLVEVITGLLTRAVSARTPDERAAIEKDVNSTGRKIDQLVYALYGLTAGEIHTVEQIVQ
jgi:hypothetical protein